MKPGNPTVPFTVYDPPTGEILRAGHCPQSDAHRQASGGHKVIVGIRGCDIRHRVIEDDSGPRLHERPAHEIEARTPKHVETIDATDIIVEALKQKGIHLTRADLLAASERVTAARKNSP